MPTKALFLTFCLLASVFSEINCQFYENHSLFGDVMSTLTESFEFMEGFKRDMGNDYCVVGCFKDMLSNISSYFPEFYDIMRELENSPSYISALTQLQFKTFCKKIFSPMDFCLGTCSESQIFSYLEDAMSLLKYMCNDVFHELYNSLPCIESAGNEITTTCFNGVCQERKDATRRLLEAAARNLQSINDLSKLNDPLAENCRLISCVEPCQAQILKSKCGADAAKLTANLTKRLMYVPFSAIEKVLKSLGSSWTSPRECTNMAADEHYQQFTNEHNQEL